jgi:transketolase
LYVHLCLGGLGLELADVEALSTVGSETPGHPEFRHTKGVEITIAMSVCAGHARTF